jgi:hypothetical protein
MPQHTPLASFMSDAGLDNPETKDGGEEAVI